MLLVFQQQLPKHPHVLLLQAQHLLLLFHLLLPVAAAVVAAAQDVSDEVCPDTEYASAGEDIVSDGRTAFRCFQCQMLYLPEAYKDGNKITNYEMCRRHIGVLNCEICARVIVGLAGIRCHRQVCQNSA